MAHIDGRSKHPLYKKWKAMRARCSHDPSYKNIKVCKRWDDFWNFFYDMGNPPTEKHQLDRINPNQAYKPENCRWVLPCVQAFNKGDYKNNKSGTKGVFKKGIYWYARISCDGKKIIVGSYHRKIDAKYTRECLARAHGNLQKILEIKKERTIKRHRYVNSKRQRTA